MSRVMLTKREIIELRAEETAKVLKAIMEVNRIEKLLKDGNLKYTKEILNRELERAINIGKE